MARDAGHPDRCVERRGDGAGQDAHRGSRFLSVPDEAGEGRRACRRAPSPTATAFGLLACWRAWSRAFVENAFAPAEVQMMRPRKIVLREDPRESSSLNGL